MMEPLSIWVFPEHKDNKLLKISREILSEGRRLADNCEGELVAVLPGYHLNGLTDDIGNHGADRVILIEHPALEQYATLPYCGVLAGLVREHDPSAFLFGATPLANDLAPRLAARIKAGLVTNCNMVEISAEGTLEATKPAYGGNVSASMRFTSNKQQLVTILPGAVEITTDSRQPQVINVQVEQVDKPLVESLGIIKADAESVDLSEAELIVSGGRGMGDREGFALLSELARLLKASVGGTRVAVDNGWIPFEKQLGQTGKIVSPGFLMTLGTSGAIQYNLGFKDAEFVMAVDKNPRAAIFQVADTGIVADVRQLVPALINLLKKHGTEPGTPVVEDDE